MGCGASAAAFTSDPRRGTAEYNGSDTKLAAGCPERNGHEVAQKSGDDPCHIITAIFYGS